MYHWPSEVVALNTTFHLVYSYKSVLFGNGLLADRVCGIFFDLCNTCYLLHALENVYYVLGLLGRQKSHPPEKQVEIYF